MPAYKEKETEKPIMINDYLNIKNGLRPIFSEAVRKESLKLTENQSFKPFLAFLKRIYFTQSIPL